MVVLLENLNLSKLSDIFEKNEVTMEDLETFNDEDLDRLGVRKFASRKRILDAVKGTTSKETHQQPQYQKSPRPSTSSVESMRQSSHSHTVKHQTQQKITNKLKKMLLIKSSKPAAVSRGIIKAILFKTQPSH